MFSQEDLEKLQEEYLAVSDKCQRLMLAYVAHNYENSRAREYARQGYSRRLQTMVRCIENVFEALPPNRVELPTNEELSDAAINIQAFVINVFGSADNLAWLWVQEKGLTKEDGSPIPITWVGLRKNNALVRGSFSPDFQEYLNGLDGWFDLLENFRHALAHRIPLYIPPYVVPDEQLQAYHEFEGRVREARNQQDYAECDRLSAEQMALVSFMPYITHSFEEEANYVSFHPQLLADLNTIEELGCKMLEELNH